MVESKWSYEIEFTTQAAGSTAGKKQDDAVPLRLLLLFSGMGRGSEAQATTQKLHT